MRMMTTHNSKRRKILHSFYISFILCMIFSCGGHRYPQQLLTADSLTEVNPDSAVALLRQLSPQMQHERKAVRMYHRLLTVKAADKADQLQPVPDSILPIVKYYEGRGDKRLLPTAYYYAGRTYYELHDAPQALDYFQKAAEVAGEDYGLKSKIYSQMGNLFMYQGLYSHGKDIFKKGYDVALQTNDTLGMIYSLNDLAFAEEAEEHHHDALKNMNKAYELALLRKDHKQAVRICQSLVTQHTIMNNYSEAHHFGKICLDNIVLLDSSRVYYLLAKLYNREGKDDSLRYYCSKLNDYHQIHAKDSISRFLLKSSIKSGQTDKAMQYLDEFLMMDDSIKKITQTDVMARVNALYNYQLREKDNVLLKQKNRNMSYVIVGIITLIFVLTIYLFYYRKQKQALSLRYMRSEQLREESNRQSIQAIHENERCIAELGNKLLSVDYENTQLRKELEHERERLVSLTALARLKSEAHAKADDSIMFSPICQRFLQTENDNPILHPTTNDWNQLESFLDKEYDHFCSKLRSLCKMSEVKYHTSLLIKIRMDTRMIAKMLNTSKSNVSSIKSRLYNNVFGKQGGAADWDNFIMSL